MSDNFKKDHFSPIGLLMFNYVFEVDPVRKIKKGNKTIKVGSDKYGITIRLFDEDATAMIELLNSFKEEGATLIDEDELTKMPYKQANDKDGNEIEGAFDFTLKTSYQPVVIDGKRNRITAKGIPNYEKGRMLGKGRVSFKPFAYGEPMGPGLSLRLQAVQVTELLGGVADLSGFEDIDDGFVADEADVSNDVDESQEDDLPDFASK